MIDSIEIRNFQSHEHTKLDLHEGLNLLTGQNHAGKTVILRGLEWLRTSRPTGSAFVRKGTEDTEVTIETEGHTISRVRKKGQNSYILDNKSFRAIGTDVPQEVIDILNMTDINFQGQMSPHYLILDSPGKIARAVNDAVHLDDAEAAASALSASVRETATEIKVTQSDIIGLELSLKLFARLDAYEPRVRAARKQQDAIDDLRAKSESLTSMKADLHVVDHELSEIPDLLSLTEKIEQVQQIQKTLDESLVRQSTLSAILVDLESTQKIEDMTEPLKIMPKIIEEIERRRTAVTGMKQQADKLDDLLSDLESKKIALDQSVTDLQQQQDEYNDLIAELDVCPTCGQKLDKTMKEQML